MTYLFILCVFLILLCAYTLFNIVLVYKHFRKDINDFYEYSMSVEKSIRYLNDDVTYIYQLTIDKLNSNSDEKV